MPTQSHSIRRPDWIILGAFTTLFVWVYAGFYFPDPVFVRRLSPHFVFLTLWLPRLLLPIVFLLLCLSYIKVRNRSWALSHIVLVAASAFICILLGYPVADYLYHRSYDKNIAEFHPFLQVQPPETQSMTKEEAALTIFCVGGSTTEFTDSYDLGWPARLESLLNTGNQHATVKVFNYGKGWYTSQHSLYNYITNLRREKPDVIIVMHAINDVLPNVEFSYFSRGKFERDYGHFYGPLLRLFSHQSLAGALSDYLGVMWYHSPRTQTEIEHWKGLESFESNLRTLAELAASETTDLILMTQPSLYSKSLTKDEYNALFMYHYEAVGPDSQLSVNSMVAGMAAYNNATRKIASETGSFLVDLENAIPKTLEYFYDDCHYQETAYDSVASYIAGRVRTHPTYVRFLEGGEGKGSR